MQQIMVNEVICARKASLDQLFDGLCVLRFNELFQSFPEEFETLFVASENLEVSSNTLLELLQANCCSEEDTVTYGHLKTYINALDLKGTHTGQDFFRVSMHTKHAHKKLYFFAGLV